MPMIGVSKLRHVVDGVIAFTAFTGDSMMELTLAAVLYCVCMLTAVKKDNVRLSLVHVQCNDITFSVNCMFLVQPSNLL